MKKYFLTLLLLSIGTGIFSQNRSIKFETSTWDLILKKAKSEKKLIMLDAYTSWCGPCKWMAKNTFTNDTVADFYNKKFINAGIDWEKGEGPALAKKYIVQGYPTLLYIDGDGMEVHRGYGAAGPKDFIDWGKQAMSPEKSDKALKSKYETSKNDKKFLKQYLEVRSKSSAAENKKVLKQYFSLLTETEKADKENMEILIANVRDIGTTELDYFKKNYEKFKDAFGSVAAQSIRQAYGMQSAVIARNPNGTEKEYNDLVQELATYKFPFADSLKIQMDMFYYLQKKDWNNYFTVSKKYFETTGKEDVNMMNTAAWNIFEQSSNTEQLEGATAWSKESVTLQKDQWAYWDTYACLLNKLNKKKEALAAAEEAVKLARAEKLSENDFAETLKLANTLKKELQ